MLIALLLPVTATAAPMTVLQTIKITAPFAGATTSVSESHSVSGCGSATIVTPPFFHLRTGVAGFSGAASSHICASGALGSSEVFETVGASVPLIVLSGMNHITASFSIKVDGGNTFHVGACTMSSGNGTGNNSTLSECYASALASVFPLAYLYDATNGTYFLATGDLGSWAGTSGGSLYLKHCLAANCTTDSKIAPGSFSFHGPAVWHFKAPGLVTSHSYFLEFWLFGDVIVQQEVSGATLGHTYGSAWLNIGTFGDGAKLNSIVIT
jgi:hypothetical protein